MDLLDTPCGLRRLLLAMVVLPLVFVTGVDQIRESLLLVRTRNADHSAMWSLAALRISSWLTADRANDTTRGRPC